MVLLLVLTSKGVLKCHIILISFCKIKKNLTSCHIPNERFSIHGINQVLLIDVFYICLS